MALGPRLDLRQSQSLVMTPQMQQAIRLLALANVELEAFVSEAMEANPLLEVGEAGREADPAAADGDGPSPDAAADSGDGEGALDIDAAALDRDRETGDGSWSAASGIPGGEAGPDIAERGDDEPDLAEYLRRQVGTAARDAREALVAAHLVGLLDEAGYLDTPLAAVADELALPLSEVERALALVQTLEPTGVGARTLAECIALQAKEADRYDPCMARLIDNLDLVARGEVARLKRMCDVDDEDFADMLAELRRYDPKPGLRHSSGRAAPIVPDILLREGPDGGWNITLNEATLPRLVVNRAYFLELREGCSDKRSRAWLREQLEDANWLIRAIDQRQKTILKVTSEIVKLQDGFFRRGVSELKPLTLARVAEAIAMHESTVSRVTRNKYIECARGVFELKYFFTSGVAAADGEGASSEAIKARIRALVAGEEPTSILSDQKLAEMLQAEGFALARRTVAKYREAIGIGSSAERRRAKKLARYG